MESMSICLSIQKHSGCNGDVSGKVNVVLCSAVKLLLLWCHLGNKFSVLKVKKLVQVC